MSVTKELIEHEAQLLANGERAVLHLHREGSFLRAYEWSAWLCCRLNIFRIKSAYFQKIFVILQQLY